MAARLRQDRPVCRLFQQGLCTLSSLQCDFRHVLEGPAPPSSLGDPFEPQPRRRERIWRDNEDLRMRMPLEEVWVPAPAVSIRDEQHFAAWEVGDGDLDHRDWRNEDDYRRMTESLVEMNAFHDHADIVDSHVPMSVSPQGHEFRIWEDGVEEHLVRRLPAITITGPPEFEIWEDTETLTEDAMNVCTECHENNQENDPLDRYYDDNQSVRDNDDDSDVEEEQASEVQPPPRRVLATRSPSSRSPSNSPSSDTLLTMNQARDYPQGESTPRGDGNGPHPSFIQVANPYIFEQKLQSCLTALGATEHKEDSIRLQGVHWIDSVRKALQLPIRTFNTAVVYYHKFRLVHADNEYMFIDAAAAALFTACKIEDTLKKSREVLCAAYNLKVALSDHLSPDDPLFDGPSKTVVGLERLMLESAGFDFRNRHPQEIVIKLIRDSNLPKDTLGRLAYNMSIDIYRTFAPLKQTAQTMAIACIELAARLLNLTTGFDLDSIVGPTGISLQKWSTTRAEIMETLLDLLDLFTHHRNATIAGGQFSIDNFITVRISLNKEASSLNLPRYSEWIDAPKSVTNGAANGSKPSPMSPAVGTNPSPNSPPAMGPTSATGAKSRVGERGKDGTVRFMLSAERARAEKEAVGKYFAKDEWEEYEEEIDVPVK